MLFPPIAAPPRFPMPPPSSARLSAGPLGLPFPWMGLSFPPAMDTFSQPRTMPVSSGSPHPPANPADPANPGPTIASPPSGLQDVASLQRYYFRLGEQYYRNNRFRHAIQAFSEALRLNPTDAVAYNKRGVAKVGIKDTAGAFADYTQALALQPGFYNAYVNRGNLWAYLADGSKLLGQHAQAAEQYKNALTDYNQAIAINPNGGVAYENRGELFATLGLRAQSLQDKATVIGLQRLKPHTTLAGLGLKTCPPRIALVMANDDYVGTENDLNGGPIHDAESMALTLEKQGFQVLRGYNLTGGQTQAKVAELVARLHENPGAISLVYYSGHGGSINGNNYLIPTDFTGAADPGFTQNAVSVDYLLKQLKYTGSYFNMIFLDACRTPLMDGAAFQSSRPVVKQWETEPGPGLSNTWIEYASRPEMPALQSGNEGLYTKYLLQFMQRPDLNLKEVSMYTSFALESNPVAQSGNQHARTQTDLSRTEAVAEAFSFARPCGSPVPQAGTGAATAPTPFR